MKKSHKWIVWGFRLLVLGFLIGTLTHLMKLSNGTTKEQLERREIGRKALEIELRVSRERRNEMLRGWAAHRDSLDKAWAADSIAAHRSKKK